MEQQDIRRIRKRIDTGLENIRSVYGCYVNGAGEIVTTMEIPVLDMDAEEREMYAGLLRKVLSGTQGRNLMDIGFTTAQVEDSDEHRLLMALSKGQLRNNNMRDLLYERIIGSLNMEGDSYVILLAADTCDLRASDVRGEEWSEESVSQFEYFICSICPIRQSRAALRYSADEREFRGTSTGSVLANPVLGFMFPVLEDGGADIYRTLYYSRSAADIHDELISGLFSAERIPMAAEDQKMNFSYALSESLGRECSLDIVASLQTMMAARAEDLEADKSVTIPEITIEDVEDMLTAKGVTAESIRGFRETVSERFDGEGTFNINNLIQKKSFEVRTPETRIVTEPVNSVRLRIETIDGITYILVPIGTSVTVNGTPIAAVTEE